MNEVREMIDAFNQEFGEFGFSNLPQDELLLLLGVFAHGWAAKSREDDNRVNRVMAIKPQNIYADIKEEVPKTKTTTWDDDDEE